MGSVRWLIGVASPSVTPADSSRFRSSSVDRLGTCFDRTRTGPDVCLLLGETGPRPEKPRRAAKTARTPAAAVTSTAARSWVIDTPDAAPLPITAATMATPNAAPTWRLMFTSPPARPCSPSVIPWVAATVAPNAPVDVP